MVSLDVWWWQSRILMAFSNSVLSFAKTQLHTKIKEDALFIFQVIQLTMFKKVHIGQGLSWIFDMATQLFKMLLCLHSTTTTHQNGSQPLAYFSVIREN